MANKVNLGNAIISNSPGTGGGIFEVAGYGAVMPGASFYATATPAGQLSTMGNSEIVLVTAKSTDDLTVTRAQKGTTAQDVDAGWILSNGMYVEDLDEKADEADLTAHVSNTSNPHSVTKSQVGLGSVTNDAQLKIASNLSDLANTTTARTNLGLGSLAIKSSVDIADINATGGTSTSFLGKDGTWRTPTNTTYTEITTAEIDAGTDSTLRTITGRRMQYLHDKVVATIAAITDIVRRTDSSISGAGWLQNSISSATDKAVTPGAVNTAVNAKEDVSNKSTTTTLGTSNTLFPTQNAVKTYVDNVGVWSNYTPTITNCTIGNGTIVSRYTIIGKTVSVSIQVQFGTTSSMGSTPTFSLPVAASSTYSIGGSYSATQFGTLRIQDGGSTKAHGGVRLSDANTITPGVLTTATAYTGATYLSPSVPMTWTSVSTLHMFFDYEAN